MTQLRGIALQEMPPGRYVEKEILHHQVGARRCGRRLLQPHFGAFYYNARTHRGVTRAGTELYLGDSCDRSQRLTAKAHGGNLK